MFGFLCLSSSLSGSTGEKLGQRIKHVAKDLPPICANSQIFKITPGSWAHIEMGKSVCVHSAGSIFINGKSLFLRGFTNLVEKTSGEGIAGHLESANDKSYIYLIESNVSQDIYFISSVSLEENSYQYITTANQHDYLNVVTNKTSDGLKGSYLLLGPKISLSMIINSGSSVNGTIVPFEGKEHYFGDGNTYLLEGDYRGLWLHAQTHNYGEDCKIFLKSDGSEWATPFGGFLFARNNAVFKESDFVKAKTEDFDVVNAPKVEKPTNYLIALLCSLAIICIALLLCCWWCMKKSKNNSGHESNQSQEITETNLITHSANDNDSEQFNYVSNNSVQESNQSLEITETNLITHSANDNGPNVNLGSGNNNA